MKNSTKSEITDVTVMLGVIGFWLANIAALITAIAHDAKNNDIVWVIMDCLLSPVGVIRGWLIWFGAIT